MRIKKIIVIVSSIIIDSKRHVIGLAINHVTCGAVRLHKVTQIMKSHDGAVVLHKSSDHMMAQ